MLFLDIAKELRLVYRNCYCNRSLNYFTPKEQQFLCHTNDEDGNIIGYPSHRVVISYSNTEHKELFASNTAIPKSNNDGLIGLIRISPEIKKLEAYLRKAILAEECLEVMYKLINFDPNQPDIEKNLQKSSFYAIYYSDPSVESRWHDKDWSNDQAPALRELLVSEDSLFRNLKEVFGIDIDDINELQKTDDGAWKLAEILHNFSYLFANRHSVHPTLVNDRLREILERT